MVSRAQLPNLLAPQVRVAVPPQYPLNLVGQLRNGCTAFLAGPCHLVTVAHCVYDPVRQIRWPGLEFSAGTYAPRRLPPGLSPRHRRQLGA